MPGGIARPLRVTAQRKPSRVEDGHGPQAPTARRPLRRERRDTVKRTASRPHLTTQPHPDVRKRSAQARISDQGPICAKDRSRMAVIRSEARGNAREPDGAARRHARRFILSPQTAHPARQAPRSMPTHSQISETLSGKLQMHEILLSAPKTLKEIRQTPSGEWDHRASSIVVSAMRESASSAIFGVSPQAGHLLGGGPTRVIFCMHIRHEHGDGLVPAKHHSDLDGNAGDGTMADAVRCNCGDSGSQAAFDSCRRNRELDSPLRRRNGQRASGSRNSYVKELRLGLAFVCEVGGVRNDDMVEFQPLQ